VVEEKDANPVRLIRSSHIHPIRLIRSSHILSHLVLPNDIADPVALPFSVSFTLQMRSRSLRSHARFRPSCVAHLGVPTLTALRLPSIGFPRTSMLPSECVLVLRSFYDPITRFVFRSAPLTLPKRYVASLTSASVLSASESSATSDVAVSPRGTPSWPAWPCTSYVMSHSFFPAPLSVVAFVP
jgi:hypothetical protein